VAAATATGRRPFSSPPPLAFPTWSKLCFYLCNVEVVSSFDFFLK
jgi:hypothetical protein